MSTTYYAQLGDVQFRLTTSPHSDEVDNRWTYARHEPIEGSPILQAIGQDLAERKMLIRLHADDGNPMTMYRRLFTMAQAMTAYPLIYGSGKYEGEYTIQGIRRVSSAAFEDGTPMLMDVELTLVEVVKAKAKTDTQRKSYPRKGYVSDGEYVDMWRYK